MTGDHGPFTHSLEAWLDTEDDFLDTNAVLQRALDQVETRPQRRADSWPDWRSALMNKRAMYLAAAAAVVVIAAIGFGLLGGFGGSGLGGPAPSTESSVAEATPEPSIAEPSSSADAFLPEGPFLVYDSPYEDSPSITMTIPASGWTYVPEAPLLEKGEEMDNVPEAWVIADSYRPATDFFVFGDPCRAESTRPDVPATSVDEIVAALASQASRDASEPVDVTVGGYAGKMITLHVPDDASFDECEGGDFQSYTIDDEPSWQWHQGPGQIDEFWFVDVDGAVVGIRVSSRPDTPTELLEEMRSIVESTTFDFP